MSNKLEYLGTVASPGAGPAPISPNMLRVRGRVARAMIAAHALAPEQAIAFRPADGDRREFAHLVNIGVLRETIKGHYWLDLVGLYLREQSRARARAFIFGTAALFIAVVLMLALKFQDSF